MGWFSFILVQLISLVLTVVGLVILIPLSASRAWVTRFSHIYSYEVTAWKGGWLTYLWSNEEDGVTGALWYRTQYGDSPWRVYVWSALRNPVGNLRWLVARKSGPFKRWTWGSWYLQMGFRGDTGWPVLSAGRSPSVWDY